MKTRQLTLIGTVLAISALSLPFIINETAPKPEIPKTPNLELMGKLVELGCTEPAINHISRYSNLLDDSFDGTYYVDVIGYPDDLSQVEFDKCISLILEIRTISNVSELDPNPHPEPEPDVMKKTKVLGIDNIMEAVDSEKLTYDEKLEYIKIRYEESPNNIPSMNIRIKDLTRNLEHGERPTFTLIETGYAIPCTHPNLEVYLLKQESGNVHTLDDLVYENKIVYPCPFYDSFYPVLKFWDETDFKPFPKCEKEGRYLIVGDSGYEYGALKEYYCNAQGKE